MFGLTTQPTNFEPLEIAGVVEMVLVGLSGATLTPSEWLSVCGSHQANVVFTMPAEPFSVGELCFVESENIFLVVTGATTMVSLPMKNTKALAQLSKLGESAEMRAVTIGTDYLETMYTHLKIRLPVIHLRMYLPNISFRLNNNTTISVPSNALSLSSNLEAQVNARLDRLVALYGVSASENSLSAKMKVIGTQTSRFVSSVSEKSSVFKLLQTEIVDVANSASQQKVIIYFERTSSQNVVASTFEIHCDTHFYDFEFMGVKNNRLWAVSLLPVPKKYLEHAMQHLRPNSYWAPKPSNPLILMSDNVQRKSLDIETMSTKIAKMRVWLDIDQSLDVNRQVTHIYYKLKIDEPTCMRTSAKIEQLFSICQEINESITEGTSSTSFKQRIQDTDIAEVDERIRHLVTRKRKRT